MNVLQSNLILNSRSSCWMSFYGLLQQSKPGMLLVAWGTVLFHENKKRLKILKVPKFLFSKGICGTAEIRAIPIQAALFPRRPSFVSI